jgi:hypothetical protein
MVEEKMTVIEGLVLLIAAQRSVGKVLFRIPGCRVGFRLPD